MSARRIRQTVLCAHESVALYDVLLQMEPSPVIRLNCAVAVAMQDGPVAGVALIDATNKEGGLADYQWVHSTKWKSSGDQSIRAGKRFPQRRIQELKK